VTARKAIAIIRAAMTVNLVVTSVTVINKVAATVTTINSLGSDLLERPGY
jgi:hypothetical protein